MFVVGTNASLYAGPFLAFPPSISCDYDHHTTDHHANSNDHVQAQHLTSLGNFLFFPSPLPSSSAIVVSRPAVYEVAVTSSGSPTVFLSAIICRICHRAFAVASTSLVPFFLYKLFCFLPSFIPYTTPVTPQLAIYITFSGYNIYEWENTNKTQIYKIFSNMAAEYKNTDVNELAKQAEQDLNSHSAKHGHAEGDSSMSPPIHLPSSYPPYPTKLTTHLPPQPSNPVSTPPL